MIPHSVVSVLAAAEAGAYVMTLDQTILYWNQAAERLLGLGADQVTGRRCYEAVTGPIPGGLAPACATGCPSLRALRAGEIPHPLDILMRCGGEQHKQVTLTPTVVADPSNDAPVLVHLFDEAEDEDEDGVDADASASAADLFRQEMARRGGTVVSDHLAAGRSGAAQARLTARETEMLALVASGRESSEIAHELGISLHTVRNHVRNLRHKLGAHNKLDAVVTALRLGILNWP